MHSIKEMSGYYMTQFSGFMQSMRNTVGFSGPEEKGTMLL